MFISPAYAQAAGTAAPSSAGGFMMLLPYLAIIPLFYFLLIRPQQKRAKEHAATIGAVKKGDKVVTAGGLIGKVTKVDDSEVEIELGANVKVRAVKSTLAEVTPAGTGKPAND